MMRLHQAAPIEGSPGLFSPLTPRLAEPELRSRVAGYLAHAAPVDARHRTDGAWVWPAELADTVLRSGFGPEPPMLDHLTARAFVPPAEVSPEVLAQARHAVAAGAGPATAAVGTFFAGRDQSVWHDSDAGLVPLEPVGFAVNTAALALPHESELTRCSAADAARLLDERANRRHDDLVRAGAESEQPGAGPWLARVFDGEDPNGRPWFSPSRLRLVDPGRRDRVAGYLATGRLVVRAAGRCPDPLAAGGAPVVPLSWRTDGIWVWQDALTYYVRTRAVAPELALLSHIEERGYRPAGGVSDEVARRAADAVHTGPMPWPPRRVFSYYEGPGLLVRARTADRADAEVLDADLRWRPAEVAWRGAHHELARVGEAEAARFVEGRLPDRTSATH